MYYWRQPEYARKSLVIKYWRGIEGVDWNSVDSRDTGFSLQLFPCSAAP